MSTAGEASTWGRQRAPIEAFARWLGAGVPLGCNFPCPLPDHSGRASFYEDPKTGVWKVRCWCAEKIFLTVAEVRASIAYGHAKQLSRYGNSDHDPRQREITRGNTEAAVWYLRAWYDAGLIAPIDIELPAAPNRKTIVSSVRDGFRLLVGLRWLTHSGQPVAYTRSFVPAWCEGTFTPMEAYHAISALAESGVICPAGHFDAGRWTGKLWLPGEQA